MKSLRFFGKLKKPSVYILRRVVGDSMLPTLRPGHIVVGAVRYAQLMPGDVVVVGHDGMEKVKLVKELKQNQVYVVGDNENHSTDSRTFGWLHLSAVAAKVIWPRIRW